MKKVSFVSLILLLLVCLSIAFVPIIRALGIGPVHLDINAEIGKKTQLPDSIQVTNSETNPIYVVTGVSGDVANFIAIEPSEFNMSASSTQYVDLIVDGTDVTQESEYAGVITFSQIAELGTAVQLNADVKLKFYSSQKTCTDSDGGLDYFTKGTVTICTFTDTSGGCGAIVDRCDGNVLTENYCDGTDGKSVKYTCPYGCEDGACVKESKCTDSDGGRNYYERGSVIYSGNPGQPPGVSATNTEYCLDDKIVVEHYCEDDLHKSKTFHCPNGCLDGACIKGKEPYCSAIGSRSECWYQYDSLIKYDNCDGCFAVCKYVGAQEGWYSSCNSALVRYEKCQEEVNCTDSDGGENYYVKGITEGRANPADDFSQGAIYSKVYDICVGSKLTEYYCDSEGYISRTYYTCPNGCKDGACIRETVTTIPERCQNHAQCSQECDNMGTEKWRYSEKWQGTCPENVYGCMTGDCCIGQCLYKTTGECVCRHTNKVDIYGDVCPSGTTCGDDCYCHPIKDETRIKITSPKDGQTVSGTVTIVAEASSTNELGEMTLTIQKEGENIAKLIPFTICSGGVACPIDGGECVYSESCKYDWDTSGHDGEVFLTAIITDTSNNKVSDSIKVNVVNYQSCSEQCRLKGYRYGTCKTVCDTAEVGIGGDGCLQVACAVCPAGQDCPPCPVHTCCCAGKKPCPYECCINDPDYLDKPCPPAVCPVCRPGEECPPCIQPKCIDHQCVWHPQEEFVLKFKAGWNMFSFPVDIRSYLTATSQPVSEMTVEKAITGRVAEVATESIEIPSERRCSSPAHIWHYSNGIYVDVLNDPYSIVNGWGYWVKMDYDCMVKLTGNKITVDDFPELNAGWNQIGASSEPVNFYKVIGNCNLLSGPWSYNSASKKYQKAQVLRPGEGYWIKVEDRCTLGSEIPPPPPEKLGISKAFRVS